jgi:hypothetical protein
VIPKKVQDVKERCIPVPQSKIWVLEITRNLGKIKDIIALSNNMQELEKASLLGSEIVSNQEKLFGFEFNNFRSLVDAAVLRVTHKWGWDMRMGINNQLALEYYRFYRMLRFGYSMAILRNDMLSKMNGLLIRLGYDVKLTFSGIPNPNEILDTLKKMEQKQLSFDEAFDMISF